MFCGTSDSVFINTNQDDGTVSLASEVFLEICQRSVQEKILATSLEKASICLLQDAEKNCGANKFN